MINSPPSTIDAYISQYPTDVQGILEELRKVIKRAAPEATETISYGIPTLKLRSKNVVHFGAYKSHVGFYPTPSAIEVFKNALSKYEVSKGTVKFPLTQPIPFDLVAKIVAFRIKQIG